MSDHLISPSLNLPLFMMSFTCLLTVACIPAPPPPSDADQTLGLDLGVTTIGDIGGLGDARMEAELSSNETCEEDDLQSADGGLPRREWTGVIYELRFARENPNGISLGYDIDQRVSQSGDPEGCYRADLMSPDGEEGIDNQFSQILPLLEAVGGEAIEGLAQGVINQGRLLFMLRLSALDDPSMIEDSCVHLESFYGRGTPQIGTLGFIVPGQTFDRDHDRPSTRTESLSLSDGKLEVSGLSLDLPIEVFDQSYLFELAQVSINGRFTQDGELHGFISAALDVEAVAQRVEMIEGGGMIAELVPRFLRQQADLSPNEDGICQALSMTLTFRARQAFTYPDQGLEASK